MVAETEWAWLAGLIDGEGCLSYARQVDQKGHLGYSGVIAIGMYSREALDRAAEIIESLGFPPPRLRDSVRSYPNYEARRWEVKINGAKAQAVLDRLRPYLTVKTAEADLLSSALISCPPGRKGKRSSPETRALQEGYHLALKEAKRQVTGRIG